MATNYDRPLTDDASALRPKSAVRALIPNPFNYFMETREQATGAETMPESQSSNPVTATETPEVSEAKKETNSISGEESAADADLTVKNTEVPARRIPEAASKEEVVETLARLLEDESTEITRDEIVRLKQQFYAFRKTELETELADFVAQGNEEAAFIPALDPAEEQFKELMVTVKDRKAALAAALEEERRQNFERKQSLIDELLNLATDTDNVNRTYPRVKEIQAEFKLIGEVPATEATDQWKSYQGAVEQFYDQLKVNKDLRDYDFRKNLEIKTLLCEEAEKLDSENDIILAFKRLQNLHDEWRQAGPVAKEVRETIWNRFKDASVVINKKYQTFFEQRKATETANEAAKTAICERLEALDFSGLKTGSDWEEMTKTILAAQEEWKSIGFAARRQNNALFARFRSLCDKFFAEKSAFYIARREEFEVNLAKKTALCERAEELSQSTDWHKTAEEFAKLQNEWKNIGKVPKKYADALWHRFQHTCDDFFTRRKKVLNQSRTTEQTNLAAKLAIIEELKAIPANTPRNEALAKVRELQNKWQAIGHVPYHDKDRVYDEYRALCDAFYARNRQGRGSMSRFEDVIKEMSSDENKLYRERERILRSFEIKRNELKTYENNLGFLTSKSKSGDSMVREMQRRIQHIKDDLASMEEKIKLIDSKLKG